MVVPAGHRHLSITDGNYLSHTTRALEVGRALRELGDTVVFAASGRYAGLLDAAGFRRREILTPDPAYIMDRTRRSRLDYLRGDLLRRCVQADLEALDQEQPDCVLGDFRWSLSISARVARVPYATVVNALWTHHYALRRSVPEGFVVRRLLGERAVAAVGPQLKSVLLRMWGAPFNRLRNHFGLPPRPDLNHHLYGDLDLLPDVATLFPVYPLPPHVHMVGPILWQGGVTSHPDRLPPVSSRPLVYASVGSTGTDLLLERLFEGLGDSGADVVLSTGGQPLPRPPPTNFHVIDIVRADDVLPRACLAVCHGGHGTVYQCLAYGVPLCGIATHNDQQWNLDRVAALGVGWRFTQEQCGPADLRGCLEAVRGSPGWGERAQALAREIAAVDGPRNAARIIRAFLQSRRQLGGNSP